MERIAPKGAVKSAQKQEEAHTLDALLAVLQDFYDHGYDRGKCEAAIAGGRNAA